MIDDDPQTIINQVDLIGFEPQLHELPLLLSAETVELGIIPVK